MEDDRFVLRSITDEIMYALMELSGQEYADVYASTMKERLAAARRSKASSVAAAAVAKVAAVASAAEEAAQARVQHAKGDAPVEPKAERKAPEPRSAPEPKPAPAADIAQVCDEGDDDARTDRSA
jgi:1-acyl-sn-glycerol-3-phosphate acyltransferase